MVPPAWIILLFLWVFGFVVFVYGLIGLKKGKTTAYARRGVKKKLVAKWAYVYSGTLVVLGGALLVGLVYNAINCGILTLCE